MSSSSLSRRAKEALALSVVLSTHHVPVVVISLIEGYCLQGGCLSCAKELTYDAAVIEVPLRKDQEEAWIQCGWATYICSDCDSATRGWTDNEIMRLWGFTGTEMASLTKDGMKQYETGQAALIAARLHHPWRPHKQWGHGQDAQNPCSHKIARKHPSIPLWLQTLVRVADPVTGYRCFYYDVENPCPLGFHIPPQSRTTLSNPSTS